MAYAGNRTDLGVDLFSPRREASRVGSAGGFFDGSVDSDSNYFLIPEFGMVRQMSPALALGVTVYGNGGMNTDYEAGQTDLGVCGGGAPIGAPGNLLCGQGSLGVDLMQLIVAPTAAYKIAANHSVGVSPLIGYQRFKAEGLHAFAGISSDPTGATVTNAGYDDAFGYGVRVGYMGKLTPTVTVGAAYASKMRFSEFEKYAGLFAEQGDFDIPENYNLGVAWQATPVLKLALDYQRINFNKVASVGNLAGNSLPPVPVAPLGNDAGSGFGWKNVDVIKLGAEYQYSNKLTLRGGYSDGENPINGAPPGEATFNIIAPAVIERHVTLGFTYTLASGDELTMAYMHAFENDVSGDNPFPFGGTDTIQMYQNSIGVQYSWK
jgi:long-chain fatty acid transport protein